MKTPRIWKRYLLGSGIIFGVVLITANGGSNDSHKSVTPLDGFDAPTQVRAILNRACVDCHSNETVWPWYSKIPPVSWQIRNDVDLGREVMNLSQWRELTPEEQRAFASQMAFAARTHLMPPPKYLWLHREARLSEADLNVLREWALPANK